MAKGTIFDEEILRLTKRLHELEVGSNEYKNTLDDLKLLEMLKDRERRRSWYNNIDSKTITTGAMMIGQTLLILNYEKLGVIASRAFPNGLIRPRI